MHFHRIAAFLAGCWILGSLFMMFVATQNFRTVDRMLAAPPPQTAPVIQTLGSQDSRFLLRQLVGQENAFFFESWELAELILGTALAGFLLFGARNRLLAGLAAGLVALVAFQHFKVTPEMVSLAAATEPAGSRADFGQLHALYGILEVVKLILAVAIAAVLLPAWRQRPRKSVEAAATPGFAHR
jgi:hypothetical protein